MPSDAVKCSIKKFATVRCTASFLLKYFNLFVRLSCVRPRRIEFTTENNKRILRPRTNIAPDTNYQLNPCFVSNLILPNPKFYCINNKFYDHGAESAGAKNNMEAVKMTFDAVACACAAGGETGAPGRRN